MNLALNLFTMSHVCLLSQLHVWLLPTPALYKDLGPMSCRL